MPTALAMLIALGTLSVARAKEGVENRLLDPKNIAPGKKTVAILPRLFDVEKGSAIPVGKQGFLPNRIYLVYDENELNWYYALTNFEGKFPRPMEFFRDLSVIPGRYLGAKNPTQRFTLTPQGVWVPTLKPEQHYFWVLSTPPRIKIVGFKKVAPRATAAQEGAPK